MNFDLRSVQDEFSHHVIRSSHFEFLYVTYLESIYDDIEHTYNTVRPKQFLKSLQDAYSKKAHKLFYAHGYGVREMFDITIIFRILHCLFQLQDSQSFSKHQWRTETLSLSPIERHPFRQKHLWADL